MIVHIALFKWKKDVTQEQIDEALCEVRALKNKVKGLIDVRCGENFSKWNEGYTHAFVVLAETQVALDAYRNHPDHQSIAKKIDEIDGGSIGVDFED